MKVDKYDRITSQVVRASADYICERCGIQNDTMQCCHDISRTYVITRYDPRNLLCMCASCHASTTKDPHLHVETFRRIKGSEENQLNRQRAHSGERLKKHEKEEIYKHYKKELERIKQLRMNGVQGKIEIEIPEVLR